MFEFFTLCRYIFVLPGINGLIHLISDKFCEIVRKSYLYLFGHCHYHAVTIVGWPGAADFNFNNPANNMDFSPDYLYMGPKRSRGCHKDVIFAKILTPLNWTLVGLLYIHF